MYLFNKETFDRLQVAFSQSQPGQKSSRFQYRRFEEVQRQEITVFRKRVLIKFTKRVEIVKAKHSPHTLADSILKGDEALTKQYDALLQTTSFKSITAAIHWVGANNGERRVYAQGFGFEFVSAIKDQTVTPEIFHLVLSELVKAGLINSEDLESVKKQFFAASKSVVFSRQSTSTFFQKLPRLVTDISETLRQTQEYIKANITSVKPKYSYDNEKALNPAFENIEQANRPLEKNGNRIWVLRTDFALVLGIKNAYGLSFAYTGLEDTFDEKSHPYIGWDDRYGHPSLTIPHDGYDGASYYAGYVAQREDCLEVLLFSGRYYRSDLAPSDIKIIEAYVALRFQQAYGDQPVVFIDISGYKNYFDLSLFLNNLSFPETYQKRTYTQELACRLLENDTDNSLLTQRACA